MDSQITLDKQTFKALVVDSRIDILKSLLEKDRTQSDLSELLGMSNSTIKEHIDVLHKAGLIEQEKTDRKWKYYSLTWKGKMFLQPREVKVLFAFCFALLAFLVAASVSTFQLFPFLFGVHTPAEADSFIMAQKMSDEMQGDSDMALRSLAVEAPPEPATFATESIDLSTTDISPPVLPWGWMIAGVLLLVTSAFLLGWIVKKPSTIVITKQKEVTRTEKLMKK